MTIIYSVVFSDSTLGTGSLTSGARYRLNASGLLESISGPRYQCRIDGLVDGILLESSKEHSLLENTDFEAADGWTLVQASVTSTAETSIISGDTAQTLAEDTAAGNHNFNRDIYALEGDVADSTNVCCWALVETVDMPYMSIMFRDKAGNFPIQRFNIDPLTADVATATVGSATQASSGIEYYGSNVYLIWGSWSTGTGANIPKMYLTGVDAAGTANSYTGTSRSFISHGAGANLGTYPQFFLPITTARTTPVADVLTYADPLLVNDFFIDLTFIGRDADLITGTPAERVLFEYGDLKLLITDNDVIADIGGTRVTVTTPLYQGSVYNCSVSKSSDGLALSVNAEPIASDTGLGADITTGTIYIGSDSSSTNHADVVIASFVMETVISVEAAISGTLGGAFESQLVNGGLTVVITLTNDTWLAAGTGPIGSTANTQAIIDGIVSAQAEAAGWNAVRPGIATTDLVRTSSTVATLTLPALVYDITANETLTVTVPAESLTAGSAVVGSPTIEINFFVPIPPTPEEHRIEFSSESNAIQFSSEANTIEFSSDGLSIMIKDEKDGVGYILREDGDFILREDGGKFVRER